MPVEPPFLAGLIAGEGHFAIRPNNGGQSWACGFQLHQRVDNTALVVAAQGLAGVGRIYPRPARGTSRPQVIWAVHAIDECLALVGLLDGLPLLGKKQGDYRIWRTAVARWASREDGTRRWPHLAELATTLVAHRHASFEVDYTRVRSSEWYRESFLAGFASAEGHFGVSRNGHPRFGIKLREDDSKVLTFLSSWLGVGRILCVPPAAGASGQVTWLVTRLTDLRDLVEVFDRHPPLGRAGRVYEEWRAVVLTRDRRVARRTLANRVRDARRELETFNPDIRLPAPASRRSRCLSGLGRWSRANSGPFTATAYTAWRREAEPGLPDRNTLARVFGSWRRALQAAGLPTDGCRGDKQVETAAHAAAERRALAEPAHRARVLRSVRRFAAELGRQPRAAEYLRWRLASDPDSPGQATIYRLFPGGWSAVLAALEAG